MALMTHPNLPKTSPAVTTEDAFHQVWEKRGWKLVQPAPEPVTVPVTLTKPEA